MFPFNKHTVLGFNPKKTACLFQTENVEIQVETYQLSKEKSLCLTGRQCGIIILTILKPLKATVYIYDILCRNIPKNTS